MYLRFAKELFILHELQHPRIVPVYAYASTLDEVTLVMKVYASQYDMCMHISQLYMCQFKQYLYV
jgi:hypothetical protein